MTTQRAFRFLLLALSGTVMGVFTLVVHLFSSLTFVVILAAGAGLGALLSARFRTASQHLLLAEGFVYAAFFVAFAFFLGSGQAALLPFLLFYLLCSGVFVSGYMLGGKLKQRRGGPVYVLGGCILLLSVGMAWTGWADEELVLPDSSRLFVGPTFLTNNAGQPEARAVLVNSDGIIVDVFDSPPADTTGFQVVRIPGRIALPGLHDAHAHLHFIGLGHWGIDLRGVTSREELREQVAAFVQAHPDRRYYYGEGWDQERFEDKAYPTLEDLEGLTDRPVFLSRVDGHSVLVNQVLLDAASIDRQTPDPEVGRILRDDMGSPTGILVDAVIDQAQRHLPEPTPAERTWMLRRAVDAASQSGLVAVHDMGMDPATMKTLLEMQQDEALPIRIFAYIRGDMFPWIMAHRLRRPWQSSAMARRKGRIEIMGIKLMVDGAMGSRGALLFESYADEPGHRGTPNFDLDVQRTVFRAAQSLDYQVATHAIGDSANAVALSWIEEHHREGNLPARIEHAQVLRPQDISRFADARIVTSMQPLHVIDDMHWTEARLGLNRLEGTYAWRSLRDAGALLTFGSDAPVSSIDPTLGFQVALTRQDTTAQPPNGWFPGERLTFSETLEAYTLNAAQAVGRAAELGSLEVGKQFDVTVFSRDCRSDSSCWTATVPTATVVGGEVYRVRH